MGASEPLRHPLGDAWEVVAAGGNRAQGGALTADVVLQNGHPVYYAAATMNDPAAVAAWAAAAHASAVVRNMSPPAVAALVEALTVLAANMMKTLEAGPEPKATQAGELAKLAGDAELWHTPDGKPYASIRIGDHTEHWPVQGKGFRDWLAHRYYKQAGRVPGGQALQDALVTIAGQARFDGDEHPDALRVAAHDGGMYFDLGDPDWRAVAITPAGWRVVGDVPVRFRRPKGLGALPCPVPGGTVDRLRPFLNLASEADWQLIVGWLLCALRPTGPYPILGLHGSQGSAKSTAARVLRALVDPSASPLRRPPREERNLAIACGNAWVVNFDNVSGLPDWLSDALCVVSTGGGLSVRQLYSDDEEAIFSYQRPILLNGIEEVATRPDLAERTIVVTMPPIGEDRRRDEATFWREFEAARPAILGALCDLLAEALDRLPNTTLSHKPRLADAALWVTAAAPGLGWEDDTFLLALAENRVAANAYSLESSPVIQAVRDFASGYGPGAPWQGTATELLALLTSRTRVTDDHGRDTPDSPTRQRNWPRSPAALGGALQRFAPNLAQVGQVVEAYRLPGTGERRWRIYDQNGVHDDRHTRHTRHTRRRFPSPGAEKQV